MSLMSILGKKAAHKSSVVRNRIKSRIKAAIGLIVTRNANVETVGGKDRLVGGAEDKGEKWVMQSASV